jgi:RNA recognition motif-containing protein
LYLPLSFVANNLIRHSVLNCQLVAKLTYFCSKQIIKLLQKIGVENIDVVTLIADLNKPGYNRGFAFLELETYRDAQIAYKKLSKKDVFGKGINIRVAWAEPLDDPDKKQMQKVSLSLSHVLLLLPFS